MCEPRLIPKETADGYCKPPGGCSCAFASYSDGNLYCMRGSSKEAEHIENRLALKLTTPAGKCTGFPLDIVSIETGSLWEQVIVYPIMINGEVFGLTLNYTAYQQAKEYSQNRNIPFEECLHEIALKAYKRQGEI